MSEPEVGESLDGEQRQEPAGELRDLSSEALRVARAIDRVCRHPGRYTITLTISAYPQQPWILEISRVELLRRIE